MRGHPARVRHLPARRVSAHLRVLRENGFATARPDGARRLYAVNPTGLRDVDAWLDRFRRFWTPHLDALETELARGRRERACASQPNAALTEGSTPIMIDVSHEINAVQRQVGTRVLEAGEARTVTIPRTYDAALDDVWDACTNPERIPRWFLPISAVTCALGGRYQLEGNAGGTIERCEPPRGFAATWEYGGEVSWIEVRLTRWPTVARSSSWSTSRTSTTSAGRSLARARWASAGTSG